jgi:hypothetical protein
MDADEHGTAEVSDRPVTFDSAMELGGFELARQWADRLSWPFPTERTARDDLGELAYMSALAEWLRRWQPIHIHRALLAGARLEDVSAAIGSGIDEGSRNWHEWALAQRRLIVAGKPGVTQDEYETVTAAIAVADITRPDRS